MKFIKLLQHTFIFQKRKINSIQLTPQQIMLNAEAVSTEISRSSLSKHSYDLVRLDNASFFVPMQDNLYDKFIPSQYKKMSIDTHCNLDSRLICPTNKEINNDVTKLMWMYLSTLFDKNYSVYILDLGAWVGDFAIRLAKFASMKGGYFNADCYDPSLAGKFIPFNARLNRVSDLVSYKNLGISIDGGSLMFSQITGHSDASRLSSVIKDLPDLPADSYMVETVTLKECFPLPTPKQHVIVKFDIEGIDAKVVMQNLEALHDKTLIVEFALGQSQYKELDPTEFVKTLGKTHTLFDVFYLPNPTCALEIIEPDKFVQNIWHRDFGYTDILAVPKSLSIHNKIVKKLKLYKPLKSTYMIA